MNTSQSKLITWSVRRHGAGCGTSPEMAELNRLAKIECLRRAKLSFAILRGADLSFADLSGADLRDADLRDANLSNANLSDADVR